MSRLEQEQQALLEALFARSLNSRPSVFRTSPAVDLLRELILSTHKHGISIYRRNADALAIRTLGDTYPVVRALVGLGSFEAMARDFWHANPPIRGEVSRWVQGFAGFVSTNDQLALVPYLTDVARLEWAIHACGVARDVQCDPLSMALLATNAVESVALVLAPGCVVLDSVWPICSIVDGHAAREPDFTDLAEKVRGKVAEGVLVWRDGMVPRFRKVMQGEASMLNALLSGRSLADGVVENDELDLSEWLPMAMQTGLVLGAKQHQSPND